MPSSHTPHALVVAFDDDHAVANAGLVLTATLTEHLDVEAVVDELVDLGDRPGHHRPGRKVLTLLHAMVAGGDAIDDADVLRTGAHPYQIRRFRRAAAVVPELYEGQSPDLPGGSGRLDREQG